METVRSRRGGSVLEACRSWFVRNFKGTEPGLCVVSAVVAALVFGSDLAANFWPEPVGYILCAAGLILLAYLVLRLLPRLLRRLTGHGFAWLLALCALSAAILHTVVRGAGEGRSARVMLFSTFLVALLALFAVSWWGLLRWKRRTATTLATALLSLLCVLLLAVFLFTEGFESHYIRQYLALSSRSGERMDTLESSLTDGPYSVQILDYGPDCSVSGGTIDLSPYVVRDADDLTASYVDAYMDYELTEVPMRGRVWYPADGDNCPVLFIAHGNHVVATESYLGYGYLGEYLASHGYVVVSVDHNACNMLSNENDGRAVLLLEHIGLLLTYNHDKSNPLYGKLDRDNIAIAGHSRGGEMVATAYLFNGYDRYPENGTVRFDYGYNIKSLIAIAPTVNQYKPADHSVELEDVNYLLLHGAADRDVTDFMGMTQYENISFTGEGDYLKSALYIAGANHGQFNELWGEYDQQGPFSALLNVESLLAEREQQQIARLFVKVFLDVTLRGDDQNRRLLTDWDSCAAQLPRTVYVQCWESSSFRHLADFEEDSDLESGTMEGVSLAADSINWWTEDLMDFSDGTSYDVHALRLRWNDTGSYILSLPVMDLSGSSVSFDICDLNEAAVAKGKYRPVDAVVELRDTAGHVARANISDVTTVYPILPVRTDKLDYLFNTCAYKRAFATVHIPVELFEPVDKPLDLTGIEQIRIEFKNSGQVAIDNIGIDTPNSAE